MTTGRGALLFGLLAIVAVGVMPTPTEAAQSTCNAQVAIDYVSGPDFPNPGDVERVRLTVGTGSIKNGTTFTLNRIRFDLDCANPPAPGSVPCTDDGLVIGYQGDGTITTTCPSVSFSTGHPAGGTPNEVVFTPSAPIPIPANSVAFCNIEFDVQILAASADGTPGVAEEVAGYNASASDGQCNNGLSSTGAQSGSLTLCPVCNDNNACTTDTCDNTTGLCGFVDMVTPTCDDTNACTTDSCNPTTGLCQFVDLVTPTCDDANACTMDSCDPTSGQCQHVDQCTTTTTTSTTTTTTSTTTTTLPTCGDGIVQPPEQCDPPGSPQCPGTEPESFTPCRADCTCCVPLPENTTDACGNMVDDDCDGLIDCADPDCTAIFPCPRAQKDPTIIQFRRAAGSLDMIRGHAKLQMASVDLTAMPVSVLLSNLSGKIHSDGLPAGALTLSPSGTIFLFRNSSARAQGGMYSVKIKKNKDKTSYTFSFTSYGDLSAATAPDMRLQFYIGDDANAARDGRIFITLDTPWTRTARGWRAPKDH